MNAPLAPDDDAMMAIVDDDGDFCALLASQAASLGYRCETYHHGEELMAALSNRMFAAVLLDINMPGMGGMATLQAIRERLPSVPIVMVTADDEIESVVAYMRAGAYDYLCKPISPERLETVLRHAFEKHRLTMQVLELSRQAAGGGKDGIVGQSPAIRRVLRMMDRVAATDVSVLIRGESGTGQELVARAIHAASSRSKGPFVALNSAAIPESLIEAELFGHEKGAFTGAVSRRLGRIEEADGGSLFLDEIGELPLAMQAKLLRVIQERQFQRLGSSTVLQSDFRLIAATHRDLASMVRTGSFREDLYFRIAVFDLEIPPLRERSTDIPLLATRFVNEYRGVTGSPARRLSPAAIDALSKYDWPGNVRELQNAIQRALILCESEEVQREHLPAFLNQPGSARHRRQTVVPVAVTPSSSINEIERAAIEDCILRSKGNVSEAMRLLKMGRNRFYRKLHKYNLIELVERVREEAQSGSI
ncbi:MAG: sigma-54-dependent Fis family transcriptional regulator [Bryobacterales bacterium]|nr:sigma-54-dependent Fis family transcriptional regulator [Bryobacterales bacterium]